MDERMEGQTESSTVEYSLHLWAPLGAQSVKSPSAMRETWVGSLGGEDPLEKGMATHSSILLPREFHGQRSLTGYSPWGRKKSQTRLCD